MERSLRERIEERAMEIGFFTALIVTPIALVNNHFLSEERRPREQALGAAEMQLDWAKAHQYDKAEAYEYDPMNRQRGK